MIKREMSEDGLKPPTPKERSVDVERIQKLFFESTRVPRFRLRSELLLATVSGQTVTYVRI